MSNGTAYAYIDQSRVYHQCETSSPHIPVNEDLMDFKLKLHLQHGLFTGQGLETKSKLSKPVFQRIPIRIQSSRRRQEYKHIKFP